MTVVFVHGVPETTAVWDALLVELGRDDVVTLSPPGFGAPVPAGFEPTSDGYRDWLITQLESIGGPVDLIGHDWGAGHSLRATTARPDLVRKLVTDIAGTADPRYEWHEAAQVWQTPGEGEAFIQAAGTMPVADRVARLAAGGMTEAAARSCIDANGEAMGTCILALYRSAVQPNMTLWGDQFAEMSQRPDTLVVIAEDDHYTGGPDMARGVAQQWGASIAELEGVGHWWMMQDPAAGAAALQAFLNA